MAEYYNVTTNLGDAEIAAAITNNAKIQITHIAFGDGAGSVPTPSKIRTTLVREVHRQAVTKYERHPVNPNWIVIETIIPSDIGGFTIREMGIIGNGKLISHGSHAPFEKVADPSGVSEYRLKFTQNITDGNVVSITLDDSLIYATQAWVEENFIKRSEIVDNLTTNDSTKPVSAKQAKNLKDELIKYMPLAGGVFTGPVTTRAAAVLVEGVSGVNDTVGSLRIPTASILNDGGFAPWITSSTVSGLGYKQHLAIGAVRGSGLWTNSGVFIAVGDNDNRSTENFRFLTGGKIEYHREGIAPPVATFLSTINTTTDSNGVIKAASPVSQLFADKIKLNSEAEQQSITFEKLGVGDYLIKGSTGLAQEGWYIEQPKDANGNVYHAVVYEQLENGDISVKTFEQKLEGTKIVADLDRPVDIKEGRFISIRLNELPQDTTAPQNPNVVDSEGNPAPSKYHVLKDGIWAISDEDAEILAAEKYQVYLQSLKPLTRRQFKLALLENGLLDQIENSISAIEDDQTRARIQIEYTEATEFHRMSDSVMYMCQLLNLTGDQVDQMWNEALNL